MSQAFLTDAAVLSPYACEQTVRQSLARQLGVDPAGIGLDDRLREDLFAVLDLVATVQEFVFFVQGWASRR